MTYHSLNRRGYGHVTVFGSPYAIGLLTVDPVCPVCDVGVLWPNGPMDQDETWQDGRTRLRPHCVRWVPSSPSKKAAQPQFSVHVYCSQTVAHLS